MDRRNFLITSATTLLATSPLRVASTGRQKQSESVTAGPLPRSVAGIQLVDSNVARAAVELSRAASPPYLFNHAMRTYLFASLLGKHNGQPVDAELLFLACVLHDLGLTTRFEGGAPFEIQGANAARSFVLSNGLTAPQADIVWDGIAMHPLTISQYKRPEIALVGAGAGADVVGSGLRTLATADVAEVVAAFPRLAFKNAFIKTCADVVRRHPGGAGRTFMQDIAVQEVQGFVTPNICPAIQAAPFDE
jgi:hypothetical protein